MDRKQIASYISAFLNAPLITLITFIPLIIKYEQGHPLELLLLTGVFGCVLPLFSLYVLFKMKIISDIYASKRHERVLPFLTTITSYTLGIISLILVNAPPPITALMASYMINGIVLMVITLKWKISIHTSGVISPVTALFYLLGNSVLPLFLLFLPVAWARLELKAHSKLQLTAGAIISSLLTWWQMAFYVNYVFL